MFGPARSGAGHYEAVAFRCWLGKAVQCASVLPRLPPHRARQSLSRVVPSRMGQLSRLEKDNLVVTVARRMASGLAQTGSEPAFHPVRSRPLSWARDFAMGVGIALFGAGIHRGFNDLGLAGQPGAGLRAVQPFGGGGVDGFGDTD